MACSIRFTGPVLTTTGIPVRFALQGPSAAQGASTSKSKCMLKQGPYRLLALTLLDASRLLAGAVHLFWKDACAAGASG